MKDYLQKLELLLNIILLNKIKADTNKGKYAFIVNYTLHKEVLDIFPSRKKI